MSSNQSPCEWSEISPGGKHEDEKTTFLAYGHGQQHEAHDGGQQRAPVNEPCARQPVIGDVLTQPPLAAEAPAKTSRHWLNELRAGLTDCICVRNNKSKEKGEYVPCDSQLDSMREQTNTNPPPEAQPQLAHPSTPGRHPKRLYR